MTPSDPHRVRLARPARTAGGPAPELPPPDETAAEVPRVRRENRAATQRVRRLAMLYVVALAAIYLALAVLARRAPGGTSSGGSADVLVSGAVALGLALLGAILTLASAPVAVEVGDHALVVEGLFGHRRTFPGGPGRTIRVVRRYAPGVLNTGPVESVEVRAGGVRRTYLLDSGTLPESAPPAGGP